MGIPAPFGGGAGTQWAFRPSDWPGKDDAFCKAPENNVPPALSMQAHSAPLGLRFYGAEWANATEACATPPALPCSLWAASSYLSTGAGTEMSPRATRWCECPSAP